VVNSYLVNSDEQNRPHPGKLRGTATAYVLALVSGFTSIVAPGSAVAGMEMVMVAPVMLFELVFGLWLAIRSVGVPVAEHPETREAIPTGLGERTAVANTSA
jgi:hypothetical protein